ncbi:MAG: alkaline phosphatase family protein [Candidatus Dormibacteria bacterium]
MEERDPIWHAPVSRRQIIRTGAILGAGMATGILPHLARALGPLPAAGCGKLGDIEHVVIFIQENRSFDHYFGSYPGVAGFDDTGALPGVFRQAGYTNGADNFLEPFHLDTADTTRQSACTDDISHEWTVQHRAWNGGLMDRFVSEHLAANGASIGPLTMGYYNRSDIPFYYAVADNFTLCDHYHCSVIGPTDPNRLYSMSAWTNQDGQDGMPPHLSTAVTNRPSYLFKYTWPTYPEQLQSAGVTWKVYSDPSGNAGDNVLPFFRNYQPSSALGAQLFARGIAPTYPNDFLADVAAGTLPQVSWVLGNLALTEHPPAPPSFGENSLAQVMNALMANPLTWARTALFYTYDENGGFFDHVAPPTAPAGTPGEYVTAPGYADPQSPIGLGFRVPLLVVSPFSRGGFVASDTFDHTSLLLFLEKRFGAEVPNLSQWRRDTVGDLTSALNFARVDPSQVVLPAVLSSRYPETLEECNAQAAGSLAGLPAPATFPPYPVPPNSVPHQEPGTRPAPSGPVAC